MSGQEDVDLYSLNDEYMLSGELSAFNKSELEVMVSDLPKILIGQELQIVIKGINMERMFTGAVLNVSRTKIFITNVIEKKASLQLKEFVERRRMFKIHTKIECVATYVLSPDGSEFMPDTKILFNILDLSIGGVGISSPASMEQGMLIGFTFNEGSKPVDLDVKILRKTAAGDGKAYIYGCQFLDIGRMEADIVNGYIFKRQIDLRDTGK